MLPLLSVVSCGRISRSAAPVRDDWTSSSAAGRPRSRQAAASRAVASGSVLVPSVTARSTAVRACSRLRSGAPNQGVAAGVELEAAEAGELAELVAELLGQLGGDPLRRGEPGGDARPLRHAEQGGLHLVGGQPPRLVRPVQRRGVPGEPALPVGQPAVQRGGVRVGRAGRLVEGRAEARRRSAAGRGRPRGCRAPGRRGRRRTAGRAPRRSRRASPRRTAPSCRGPPSRRSGWRSSGTCRCPAGRG